MAVNLCVLLIYFGSFKVPPAENLLFALQSKTVLPVLGLLLGGRGGGCRCVDIWTRQTGLLGSKILSWPCFVVLSSEIWIDWKVAGWSLALPADHVTIGQVRS